MTEEEVNYNDDKLLCKKERKRAIHMTKEDDML